MKVVRGAQLIQTSRRDDIPPERRAPPELHGLFCWLRKVSWRYTMFMNGSSLNSSALDPSEQALHRPPWVTTTLGCFLIFTIVVDILGNLLVIFSVYRNKKLRNAGELCARAWTGYFTLTAKMLRLKREDQKIHQTTTLTGRIRRRARKHLGYTPRLWFPDIAGVVSKSVHQCFPLTLNILQN